jgi:plastocyanin
MKNITLFILMLASAWKGNCTIHTITTPGFSFSPSTITIQEGDTIDFSIGGIHNALEVSQTTWNANGNTPLPGGFSAPFGGGLILPADLTVGTHFYVCMPHASQGMKGMIIVEPTTSIDADPLSVALSVFPNPSSGQVTLRLNHPR